MKTTYIIRPATIADANEIVPILLDVLGDIADTLAGSNDRQTTLQVITHFFKQTDNRLSYKNCSVMVCEGQIVGGFVAYHGSQMTNLDQPYIDRIWRETGQLIHIVKEAQDDEYYLDTIGILAQHRNKGLGTALIQQFEQEACSKGYKKVALLVDKDNGRAYALYQSLGYVADSELIVCGHEFWHLVKQLL